MKFQNCVLHLWTPESAEENLLSFPPILGKKAFAVDRMPCKYENINGIFPQKLVKALIYL